VRPGGRGAGPLTDEAATLAAARAGSAADYWTLTIALDPPRAGPGERAQDSAERTAASEALANFLWENGALGVVEETLTEGSALRAYFPPGVAAAALAGQVREYAREIGVLGAAVDPAGVSVAPLIAEAWAEAWRAHFRPLAVGRRVCVSPPWESPPAALVAGREVIWIEPGRAFGTGSHPTTRGCLELLERALERGPVRSVLDVGTGSGILAIAALRLGVPQAQAIDPDPEAVAAALTNARRNGMADRLRVEALALENWSGSPSDVVFANLLAVVHVAHARPLARTVAGGGWLIAGGLLVHEVPAVVGALAPHGLWLAEMVEHEEWASLALRRTP
jgi:ribosomal protein L11 methyltransferase